MLSLVSVSSGIYYPTIVKLGANTVIFDPVKENSELYDGSKLRVYEPQLAFLLSIAQAMDWLEPRILIEVDDGVKTKPVGGQESN